MMQFPDIKFKEYESAFKEYKELLTTSYSIDSYPPKTACNQVFGNEFPGALIQKPFYENCKFFSTNFISSDGAFSRFHNCDFISCLLDNCDLRYCDIKSSKFFPESDKLYIRNCNFSFSNLIDTNFVNCYITGCSFRQMQCENTSFTNCTFENSSIEQSNIKNCEFINVDFRYSGIRYCMFENVTFKNVVFHILDLPKNYGLIHLLKHNPKEVHIFYSNGKQMSLDEALTKLQKLIPYYSETKQFYELLIIYDILEDYVSLNNILPFAFKYVIDNFDFASLQDLCALIVKFNIFTPQKLRMFYNMIDKMIIPSNFPYYLRKSYNTYIENIKYMLSDNPYGYPQANILLKTNIKDLSDKDMLYLLHSIETNIDEFGPDVDYYIQLSKHSPYDVLIVLIGLMPQIQTVCQVFYYSLGGVKSFSDLKGSLKEKTEKSPKSNLPSKDDCNIKNLKHLEISLGKNIYFKYENEYTKRVKSLEYTIK